MTQLLRSTNISLHLFDQEPLPLVGHQLWQTLRRTAVEPSQASVPDLFSFADECLLCAEITINTPTPTQDAGENANSLFTGSSHTLLPGYTLEPPPTPSTDPSPPNIPEDERVGFIYLPGYTLEPSPTPSTDPSPPNIPEDERVGLIYLHVGPASVPAGEASIGVIMKQDMRRRGYAREAVQLVLGWAFEELKFHRVQAAILDTPFMDRALRLFIGSGFVHEGTRRRAVYQPEEEGMAGTWKDVTYLAMLDTEWVLRSICMQDNRAQGRPVVTAWDEMFARHAREREELLNWEEKHGRMRRPSSTETLRENVRNAPPDLAYLTDYASSTGEPSLSGSGPPSPIPNTVMIWDDDAVMGDVPSTPELPHQERVVGERHGQDMGDAPPQLPTLDRPLSLPSIPSPVPSEYIPQSPVTILLSSPGSSPSSSPSPSPTPSIYTCCTDSEDEDGRLPDRDFLPSASTIQFAVPRHPHRRAGPTGMRARSRSGSAPPSSSDSWSDGEDGSSSTWDVISSTSDRSHRVCI